MAADQRPPLRPLRVGKPSNIRSGLTALSPLPKRVPARPVAPHRVSTTEGNGAGLPRADLHIALLARTDHEQELFRRIRVIQPPLWPGRVHLHIIFNKDLTEDDVLIAQTVADLGWGVIDILTPESVTEGYPSETKK